MNQLEILNKQSSRQEILETLITLFSPYASELLNSGADFSYMNMYADNFNDQLIAQTSLNEEQVYDILNEACNKSWQRVK